MKNHEPPTASRNQRFRVCDTPPSARNAHRFAPRLISFSDRTAPRGTTTLRAHADDGVRPVAPEILSLERRRAEQVHREAKARVGESRRRSRPKHAGHRTLKSPDAIGSLDIDLRRSAEDSDRPQVAQRDGVGLGVGAPQRAARRRRGCFRWSRCSQERPNSCATARSDRAPAPIPGQRRDRSTPTARWRSKRSRNGNEPSGGLPSRARSSQGERGAYCAACILYPEFSTMTVMPFSFMSRRGLHRIAGAVLQGAHRRLSVTGSLAALDRRRHLEPQQLVRRRVHFQPENVTRGPCSP